MLQASDFDNLPDDADVAFLQLCSIAEKRYNEALSKVGYEENAAGVKRQLEETYVMNLRGASKGLQIKEFKRFWDSAGWDVKIDEQIRQFRAAVSEYIGFANVVKARRNKQYSVKFDEAAKTKLRFILAQMREAVEKLETSDDHKHRILAKIQQLDQEIDQARARLAPLGDLLVAIGGILGDAAERAEPLVRAIERIGAVFYRAQRSEQESLPAPDDRKQIEGPAKEHSNGATAN
jgi:hypothetical protein